MTITIGQTVKFGNKNYTVANIIESKPSLAAHQIAKGFAPYNYILTRTSDLVETKALAQFSLVTKKFR